jgi:hypothetical protein
MCRWLDPGDSCIVNIVKSPIARGPHVADVSEPFDANVLARRLREELAPPDFRIELDGSNRVIIHRA